MKRKILFLFLAAYMVCFFSSVSVYQNSISSPVVSDKGRLLPVQVKSVVKAEDRKQLQKLIKDSNQVNDKFSIAGMQHSQGGHTYYPNAIMLDMRDYDQILDFDPKQKEIMVQSGATWDDIQKHINPYGLAVKVMQSQNIFTVGGALSVNVHGRDIRNDALIDTVKSFRLLAPDGRILNVSKTENAALFPLVIGGYGLFGVILDVTLKLTDDELYQMRTKMVDYQDYPGYFKDEIKKNPKVKMHLARISVAPKNFLKDMYITDYLLADDQSRYKRYSKLKNEGIVAVPKFFLGMSRYSDWGKNVFWELQKNYSKRLDGSFETRNNVMRSESAFMEYESGPRTEILQEYFVPVDQYPGYIDDLRSVLKQEKDFNLLNITVRFVEKNEKAVLSYAKDDMFALVLLINQGRSTAERKETERVIRRMIDVTLKHDGSYYLPYYHYPTQGQLKKAYPRIDEFFTEKTKFDPNDRFVNLFYEEYGK
ncbi:FAD-binding oxidoreductase [Peribacillus saganii]|uniref:FAD-binding oxidoreductase n=1 Tax=Peribacillus saganii TaxID=2303992 RepID=A0A372LT28_9BACI|nr:FAD-binding oxidoreductase [Peribacillus saganii]RFU70942.1 FAD-binding oxidoreductase [Peribacillus saganii]